MKELKPSRSVLKSLVHIASDSSKHTHIVCVCSSQRHIKAYAAAIIGIMFDEAIIPWGVENVGSSTTTMTVGGGVITLLEKESYDPDNFPAFHKGVIFI